MLTKSSYLIGRCQQLTNLYKKSGSFTGLWVKTVIFRKCDKNWRKNISPPVFHWAQLAPALYRDISPCLLEFSLYPFLFTSFCFSSDFFRNFSVSLHVFLAVRSYLPRVSSFITQFQYFFAYPWFVLRPFRLTQDLLWRLSIRVIYFPPHFLSTFSLLSLQLFSSCMLKQFLIF